MNKDKNKVIIFVVIAIFLIVVINESFTKSFIMVIGILAIISFFSNRSFNIGNSNFEDMAIDKDSKNNDIQNQNQSLANAVIYNKIKMDIPYFNEEKFLDSVRIKMVNLYKALKDSNYTFLDNIVEEKFLLELKKVKSSLFEFGEVDFLTVHGRKIIAYRRKNDFCEIDVKLNAIHIDYMNNNVVDYHPNKKKYIEDMYLLTLKAPSYFIPSENRNKCDRCGAIMKRDKGMSIYRCEYCGNTKVLEYEEWKISNIERMR